jgi:hypothetical protein
MKEKDKKFPKVLLACPINIVKDYCIEQWMNTIKNLTYCNYDIYLVDNTRNTDYHKNLRKIYNVSIDHVDPANKEARFYMAESIEKIRQRAVKRNYDYLFILEIDIFPPMDIIELLLAHDKDVVGASYWTGHGDESFLQLLWLQQTNEETYVSQFFKWPEIRKFYDGKLKKAFANGNGCILIKNHVLHQLRFRVEQNEGGHADSFFHKDLFLLGIENWIDTSIIPTHWNSRWSTMPDDAGHAILWAKLKYAPERMKQKGIHYNL